MGIFQLFIALIVLAVTIALLLAALIILLISIIYFVLFVWDIITGNWLYRKISDNDSKFRIKWIDAFAKSMKEKLKPKEHYARYETPLFALCFTFTAISYLTAIIGQDSLKSIMLAVTIYIATYIIGMRRKYSDTKKYSEVLQANMEFLKLSFVPLVFFVTVAGFLFTFMGTFVGTEDSIKLLNEWLKYFEELRNANVFSISGYPNIGIDTVVTAFLFVLQLCILFYLCSIPLQLFTYFIMLVIKYFLQYGKPYKVIVRTYLYMVYEFIFK